MFGSQSRNLLNYPSITGQFLFSSTLILVFSFLHGITGSVNVHLLSNANKQ